MKKIIIGFLLLLAIIAGVFVFSVVRSFDVDTYKAKLIASLESLTGRKVQFKDAELSWRPTPTFMVNDLVISNQDGGSTPNMISVKQIQAQMDWSSLFGGDLQIKKVILKDLNVLVERLHTYQTNFSFPVLFNADYMIRQDDIIDAGSSVRIKTFELENATITYHNALMNQTMTLKGIYGSGSADSLQGPFSFKGHINLNENDLNVELETQKIAISQPLVGKMAFSDPASETQADISFILSGLSDSDWLTLDGYFFSVRPKLLFERFSDIIWPLDTELKGSFKFVVNPQENLLKELTLVQNNQETDITLNFSAVLDEKTKKDKILLEVNRLDYTLWSDVLKRISYDHFLKTKQDLGLDVSVNQMFYNNQTISDILLQGAFSDKGLDATFGAKLPFDSALNFKGKYDSGLLNGDLTLKTSDLKSFIQWLDVHKTLTLPDIDILSAQLLANITYAQKEKKIQIQSAEVGEIKFSGLIEKTQDAIKTDLKIQDLNLDTYFPELVNKDNEKNPNWLQEKLKTFLNINKNLYLSLNVNNITLLEKNFDEVIFNAKNQGGKWDFGQVVFKKKDDIDVSFSGKIMPIENADYNFDNTRLDLNIYDLATWNQWLPFKKGKFLERLSSVSGTISYTGTLKKGYFDAQLDLDTLSFSGKGQIDILKQDVDNVQLKLKDNNFIKLMDLIYPEHTLSEKWDVPVELNGRFSWNQDKKSWSDMMVLLNKDSFKSSGEWGDNGGIIDISADTLTLDVYLPNIQQVLTSKKLFDIPEKIPNLNLNLVSKDFNYADIQGKQLRLKAVLQDQKLQISSFDCLVGDKEPGRISANGNVVLDKMVETDFDIEIEKINLNNQDLAFNSYRFTEGYISGKMQVKGKGDSWFNLVNSSKGSGQMNWEKGVLYGVDASAWLSAVQSSLMAEQIGQGFSSRLKYAFENGKTDMPVLSGSFVLENGIFNISDVQGENDLISVKNGQMEISPLSDMVDIKMPLILTVISKLPAVVFDFNNRSYNIQRVPFEQAFDEELRLKNRQTQEARQLQNLRDTENKNKQMRQEAQNIMKQTEQTLKQLQERVALRGDMSDEKLDELNFTAREIRELAVKTDLMPSEYAALLEKAKLWAIQVNELNNSYARQDLLSQKAKTNQLSPLVSNYLAAMEQFWQQNPQSVILAEIVMNARQVAQTIKADEKQLSVAQDAATVQTLILRIQDNFAKIEKAHQYAQKIHLSLMNGGSV